MNEICHLLRDCSFYFILSCNSVGAINGSDQFPLDVADSDTLRLIETSIVCNGTESHLSECPKVEYDPTEISRCGALQNAYMACQGTHHYHVY